MPNFLEYVKPNETWYQRQKKSPTTGDMGNDQPKPYSDIGARLKWHRDMLGMEQAEYVARTKSVKRSAYSNWEVGSSRLSLNGALDLCDTYGLSLDFLYLGNADTLPMALRNAWLSRSNVSK